MVLTASAALWVDERLVATGQSFSEVLGAVL